MIKKIKTISSIAVLALVGGMLVINCEAESDRLGEQFFEGNGAVGTEVSYDVIAYNIFNNDTLRTDAALLSNVVLGAFNEGVFGKQKVSYVTQARLSKYNPTFGTNPEVDSVVLSIKPNYVSDSVTTSTDESYIYPDGNIPAKKVVNTYPMTRYGKVTTGGVANQLTLQVHEVTDFLGGYTDKRFSNENVNVNPTLLGQKVIKGTASSVQIINKSTGNDIVNLETGIRVNLDKAFFKSKIIDKEGSVDLRDAANFIRWFKGVKLSVVEDDGYTFSFLPSDVNIKIYYKYEEIVNGVVEVKKSTVNVPLGVTTSTKFSQISYDRNGSLMQPAMTTINNIDGDKKIFAQGMGGPSIGIRIPDASIQQLRTLYTNDHSAILTAKIRLYTDKELWDNSYTKPQTLSILQKGSTTMLTDLAALSSVSNFSFITPYNLDQNPAHYDFTVTQTVKDIVESAKDNKDFVINIGGFLRNTSTGVYLAPRYTSRAFTPNRAVFVGTDASNVNRAKINIIYGTKIQ